MCLLLLLIPEITDKTTAAEQTGSNVARDHHSRLMSTLSNFRHIQNNVECTICNLASYGRRRTKRGTIVQQAVFKGYKAAKFLLEDAQPVPKGEKIRSDKVNEFLKPGGFLRAYNEFRVLEPSNLREYGPSGYRTMMGNVGDRVLILNQKGFAGVPQLEIIKHQRESEISIIYYTDTFP